MNFRREADPAYKRNRLSIRDRHAAERQRQLLRFDPPLGWVLTGPAWPCCPELQAKVDSGD